MARAVPAGEAGPPPRPSPLARYLLLAYVLLIIYASLYPFSGWRDQGVSPFAYLTERLPRYITAFDVVTNLVAYMPLGFFALLALHPLVRGKRAFAVASLAGCVLSFAMEALQTYLPSRISSNLDFATNSLGAFVGAGLALCFGVRLLGRGKMHELRHRWVLDGHQYDLGLVLLGLWLFTQLNPATLLFGNGDLRALFEEVPAVLHPADVFIQMEAAVTASNTVAIGLFMSCLTQDKRPLRGLLLVLLAAALALKTVAVGELLKAQTVFAWLTPGALLGLVAGVLALIMMLALPRAARMALAGLLLMAATVLVNLAPENPYFADALQFWPQGYFLNFNGVTHLVSLAWPFAALFYLMLLAPRSGGEVRDKHDRL
jgi:VanZ family protein